MELPSRPQENPLSSDERQTLEIEYQAALEMFKTNFTQAWQTFAVVSTLALAGLAFIGQIKASGGGKVTWPASVAVGLAMIIILIGWTVLARRWWAYAGVHLYRMREIETRMGIMYMTRETHWIRRFLSDSELSKLSEDEQHQYHLVRAEFPKFPHYRWRQEIITLIMISALILIWILFIVGDILSLI